MGFLGSEKGHASRREKLILEMEAGPHKILVNIYQIMWHHTLETNNQNHHV
jgi:hypothetical protein